MSESESRHDEQDIDWSLATWAGARREQLRRWAELPLERQIMALEEMEELAGVFAKSRSRGRPPGRGAGGAE